MNETLSRYNALVEAAAILRDTQTELNKRDGMMITPAWTKVFHAKEYVLGQAELLLADDGGAS